MRAPADKLFTLNNCIPKLMAFHPGGAFKVSAVGPRVEHTSGLIPRYLISLSPSNLNCLALLSA